VPIIANFTTIEPSIGIMPPKAGNAGKRKAAANPQASEEPQTKRATRNSTAVAGDNWLASQGSQNHGEDSDVDDLAQATPSLPPAALQAPPISLPPQTAPTKAATTESGSPSAPFQQIMQEPGIDEPRRYQTPRSAIPTSAHTMHDPTMSGTIRHPPQQPPPQTAVTIGGMIPESSQPVGANNLSWCHPDLRGDLAAAAVSSCVHSSYYVADHRVTTYMDSGKR
jgi:hypothetical protein